MLYWLDLVQVVAIGAIVIGGAVVSLVAWRQNWRESREASTERDDRYNRFMRFLAMVREARR